MSLSSSWSGTGSPTRSVRRKLRAWLVDTPNGGPVVVIGLGIGHLIVAAWNFNRELRELSAEAGPLLAAALIALVALLVCLVGYWLWVGVSSPRQRWLVAAGSVTGSLVVGGIIYISILIRVAEGRTVSEPLFVLSLASSQGAFAGAVVSILYGRAQREAAAARRRRDQMEFVTGILRHDVLNSMMVIRSRAELLADGDADRQAESVATIVGRSQKVIDLAEHVKEVVSVMGDDGTLERKPVDLAPLVASQIDAVELDTDDVTIDSDIEDVQVLADELLSEVVGNLLENALTHGLDGAGRISVTTERAGDRIRLRVADTGSGVPDEMKREIFRQGTSRRGGGFGLFFAATMLDHYGGDIWVEDRSDGEGAVFVVELAQA